MAEKQFLLPDLGEGLTEGEIVSWLVAVGDAVEVDQPVVQVETAKAVVEVPSPFAGVVTALHAGPGDEVEVGKPLMSVDVAEDESSGSVLVGYGTGEGRRSRRRRGGERPPPGPGGGPRAGVAAPPARPLAKPPVRKRAKELGIDLAEVPGSGPGGVVTREDLEAYAGNGRRREQAEPRVPVAAPTAASPDLIERVPLRGIRKRIAEHMTLSRREIPEATCWVDCDATALWVLREELAGVRDDVRVTPLAIILRAVVAALREFPQLNARLDSDAGEILLQRFVNLGVAVHTDRGLLVPVIKGAERRSMIDLARELQRLAAAARDGSIGPEELTGSTFTVSNYGAFGVDGGSAVINYPEAAILGVGRISDKPWVVDGKLEARKVVQLSLAFDHRICDGGEAAGFLRFLADCVEDRARLLAAL